VRLGMRVEGIKSEIAKLSGTPVIYNIMDIAQMLCMPRNITNAQRRALCQAKWKQKLRQRRKAKAERKDCDIMVITWFLEIPAYPR
jgi:hypothetical protein